MRKLMILLERFFFHFKKPVYPYVHPSAAIDGSTTVTDPSNLIMGAHSKIGNGSYVMNPKAKLILKDYSRCAFGLTVVTGKHPRVIGRFRTMALREEQEAINKVMPLDEDVIVEEDTWIGCRTTLLAGVTVHRGATITAGAVVVKDVPPYCYAGGVPAKFIKFYWSIDEIMEHETKLYPEDERYTREELEKIFAEYQH